MNFRWTLIPAVFLLDRLLKVWVVSRLSVGESVPFIPGVLHWTRVSNTGAAFGLARGSTVFLIAVTGIVSLVILLSLWRSARRETRPTLSFYAWSLILGGALGNLYDRVRVGYVIDFIDLRVWPVFNLADACISIGAAMILWSVCHASHSR